MSEAVGGTSAEGQHPPAVAEPVVRNGRIRVGLAVRGLSLLAGLGALIAREADLEVSFEISLPTDLLRSYDDCPPDVVVLDVALTDRVAALRAKLSARGGVIGLLPEDALADRLLALAKVPFEGLVLRDGPPSELLEAIRVVGRGDKWVHPTVGAALFGLLGSPRPPSGAVPVSDRELQVLNLLSRGHTIAEIGGELYLSDHGVKWHLANLRASFRARNSAHLIALAHWAGYLR